MLLTRPTRVADQRRFFNGLLVLTEDSGLVFVLIPGGKFWMGAQKDDPDGQNYDPRALPKEGPVHEVELSPYFLSKYEMTRSQWQRITAANPSYHYPALRTGASSLDCLYPVEQVSWIECYSVMKLLDIALPTEAQWECGARGGTSSVYWTGADPDSLIGAVGEDNSISRVGSWRANGFGIHDTCGNVQEWCFDDYGDYASKPIKDPIYGSVRFSLRPVKHWELRVFRDRGFTQEIGGARAASRQSFEPEQVSGNLGLRPASSPLRKPSIHGARPAR